MLSRDPIDKLQHDLANLLQESALFSKKLSKTQLGVLIQGAQIAASDLKTKYLKISLEADALYLKERSEYFDAREKSDFSCRLRHVDEIEKELLANNTAYTEWRKVDKEIEKLWEAKNCNYIEIVRLLREFYISYKDNNQYKEEIHYAESLLALLSHVFQDLPVQYHTHIALKKDLFNLFSEDIKKTLMMLLNDYDLQEHNKSLHLSNYIIKNKKQICFITNDTNLDNSTTKLLTDRYYYYLKQGYYQEACLCYESIPIQDNEKLSTPEKINLIMMYFHTNIMKTFALLKNADQTVFEQTKKLFEEAALHENAEQDKKSNGNLMSDLFKKSSPAIKYQFYFEIFNLLDVLSKFKDKSEAEQAAEINKTNIAKNLTELTAKASQEFDSLMQQALDNNILNPTFKDQIIKNNILSNVFRKIGIKL